MKVSSAAVSDPGCFRVMDRSRRVLAGPQIAAQRVHLAPRRRSWADSQRLRTCESPHPSWRCLRRVSEGVRLAGGRGRPPSEAQVLGLMPAAQLCPAEGLFQSRPVGGDHALLRRPAGLPVSDLLAIGMLSLLCDFELAQADVLERVRGRGAFAALASRQAGAQLKRAALLLGQRWSGE